MSHKHAHGVRLKRTWAGERNHFPKARSGVVSKSDLDLPKRSWDCFCSPFVRGKGMEPHPKEGWIANLTRFPGVDRPKLLGLGAR